MVLLPDERAWGALTFAKRFQTELARHRTAPLVSCGIAEASAARERGRRSATRPTSRCTRRSAAAARSSSTPPGSSTEPAAPADEIAARRHRRLRRDRARAGRRRQGRRHPQPLRDRVGALRADRPGARALRRAGRAAPARRAAARRRQDRHRRRACSGSRVGSIADERRAMSCHVRTGTFDRRGGRASWRRPSGSSSHHEFLDGSGYPEGIRGSAIPLESRIIQVADAFEAMTANRPYRAALRLDEAFAELERGTGTQFDATCVAALRSALGSDVAAAAALVRSGRAGALPPPGRGLTTKKDEPVTHTHISIDELLAKMVEHDASDLHLAVGSPPVMRVHGQLERLPESEKLTSEETRTLDLRDPHDRAAEAARDEAPARLLVLRSRASPASASTPTSSARASAPRSA